MKSNINSTNKKETADRYSYIVVCSVVICNTCRNLKFVVICNEKPFVICNKLEKLTLFVITLSRKGWFFEWFLIVKRQYNVDLGGHNNFSSFLGTTCNFLK